MESLGNDIFLSILEQASEGQGHYAMREVLPLICKRWKDTIYGAKGEAELCRAVAL